jgi:hypothetical protein
MKNELTQSRLTKPIYSLTKLHQRHKFAQSLSAGWLELETQPGTENFEKLIWLASTVHERLNISDTFEAPDANAMFELLDAKVQPTHYIDRYDQCAVCSYSDMSRIDEIVKRNHRQTLFMIHFLAGLCPNGLGLQHGLSQGQATSLFKTHFSMFYANFRLYRPHEAQNLDSQLALPLMNPLGFRPYSKPSPDELLMPDHLKAVSDAAIKLPQLFRHAIEICPSNEPQAMINVICQTADTYRVHYFKYLFLPFLRGMLPILAERGIDTINSMFRELYTSVLSSYSRRYVGDRPPCPEKDWARSQTNCTCRDCTMLNAFIISPTETVARFAIGKGRRQHLQSQLDASRDDYSHVTERMGNPQTLVVTKKRTRWETDMKDWETRSTEAKRDFESIGLGVLRQLLGDKFRSITGLSNSEYQRVAKRQRPETGPGYHHILLSYTNLQNVGRVVAGGAGSKRTYVETVDLTKE